MRIGFEYLSECAVIDRGQIWKWLNMQHTFITQNYLLCLHQAENTLRQESTLWHHHLDDVILKLTWLVADGYLFHDAFFPMKKKHCTHSSEATIINCVLLNALEKKMKISVPYFDLCSFFFVCISMSAAVNISSALFPIILILTDRKQIAFKWLVR